jgi:hypothetical protein
MLGCEDIYVAPSRFIPIGKPQQGANFLKGVAVQVVELYSRCSLGCSTGEAGRCDADEGRDGDGHSNVTRGGIRYRTNSMAGV